MANTLYEFYTQKGQALPPWQERAKLAQQYGIADYTGTAEQNTALLAKLQTTPSPGIVQVGPTPITSAAPIDLGVKTDQQEILDLKQKIADTTSQIEQKKTELAKVQAFEAGRGTAGEEVPPSVAGAPSVESAERAGRIEALEGIVFAKPTKSYGDIKKDVYADLGIDTAASKAKIAGIDAEIDRAKSDLVTAEGEITRNAWLSEEGRVGRIKTLYSLAEKTISNLLDKRNQAWQLYTYEEDQADKAALRIQAEEEAGRKLSEKELDYLRGLQKGEIPEKPSVFGSSTTGYYIWEQNDKGQWTTKQVIAPKKDKGTPQLKQDEKGEWVWIYPDGTTTKTGITGKEAKPTTTEQKQQAISDMAAQLDSIAVEGFVSQEDYNKARAAWQAAGLSITDFDKEFSDRVKDVNRTRTDKELREKIEDDYRGGAIKEDIIIKIEGGAETSQADKDRALELVNEMMPDEMNKWLKEAQANPGKYKITEDGIYEIKKWMPDKRVYQF